MEVQQIMSRDVKVCHTYDSLNKAAQVMWEEPCGAVPVVDEERKPVGFLTDRDVCMAAYTQGRLLADLSVEGAMSRKVVYCRADDDLRTAATLMREHRARRLPVIDRDGKLTGLLSLDDLAHEAARTLRGGVNEELRDLVLEIHLAIHHGRLRLRPPA
jgi:CBS-domain-containing membrane protein